MLPSISALHVDFHGKAQFDIWVINHLLLRLCNLLQTRDHMNSPESNHTTRTLCRLSRLGLETRSGTHYITYSSLLLLHFLSLVPIALSPAYPFRSNPKSPPISRCALARTAPGSFGLDWAPNVGAERGSTTPYTSCAWSRLVLCSRVCVGGGFTTAIYVRLSSFMS
jgi:hypothetical protein